MKGRILFAFFTVILFFNLPSISMAQVLKPDLMFCGVSQRHASDLYLGIGSFNEVQGCLPDANTQALLITNDASTIDGNGAAWLAYLDAGGVIIASAFVNNEIYNEIYATNYFDTFPFPDGCGLDPISNAMPSLKLNTDHAFWMDNSGLTETDIGIAGCGSDNAAIVDGEAEVTSLGGLIGTEVISFAIRPQGPGVLWLLEANWPDQYNPDTFTDDSKNFMGALISNGADMASLIFEDGFE